MYPYDTYKEKPRRRRRQRISGGKQSVSSAEMLADKLKFVEDDN